MSIVIGIDPGASGAICAIYPNGRSCDFVKLSETEADIANQLFMYSEYNELDDGFAYIERVHSSPQMGVTSAFSFGKSYGFLRGLLIALKIPFEEVTPQKWQKAMGCMTKGDKNVSKARAQQLFPQVKVTHAIADALLIAEYGRRLQTGQIALGSSPAASK